MIFLVVKLVIVLFFVFFRSMSNMSVFVGFVLVGLFGFWKSLLLNMCCNVKIGVVVCIVMDVFVLYKYFGVFGLKME